MRSIQKNSIRALLLVGAMVGVPSGADAMIMGEEGTDFHLTAKDGFLTAGDGSSVYFWGLAHGHDHGGMPGMAELEPQYPAPTLIVNQGDLITVELHNELQVPVSLLFPGFKVTPQGGVDGILTREAPALTGAVVYTFIADHPGTFLYFSGTQPDLQVEMGLVGALIVRPAGYNASAPRAYHHQDSEFDREFLFLLTEMDPRIHDWVLFNGVGSVTSPDLLSDYSPMLWFINGRAAPDTMAPDMAGWLPTQPYASMPMMYPGEKVLLRVLSGGRDVHPFHTHGNHSRVIARDGFLLESGPGAGADLSVEEFTIPSIPGGTVDAVFQWTGEKLGWDAHGSGPGFEHDCVDLDSNGFDDASWEYCADHGKPLPVDLPGQQALTFGGWYSGSPFLGAASSLPIGEGGMNPTSGFVYMWHSHNEKEIVNYDIFPGGMMTMLVVVPRGVPMPAM